MALIKQKQFKGFTAEYWKITTLTFDLMSATVSVRLSLFKDKPTRDLGQANEIDFLELYWSLPAQISTIAEMKLNSIVAFLYNRIMESDEQWMPVLGPDGLPTYDGDGNMITEYIETNWFADAVNQTET